MLDGHGITDIREALAAKHPEADPPATLAAALQTFDDAGRSDPVVIRGWTLEAYRTIYQKMLSIGDYANALKAVKLIYDIAGKT